MSLSDQRPTCVVGGARPRLRPEHGAHLSERRATNHCDSARPERKAAAKILLGEGRPFIRHAQAAALPEPSRHREPAAIGSHTCGSEFDGDSRRGRESAVASRQQTTSVQPPSPTASRNTSIVESRQTAGDRSRHSIFKRPAVHVPPNQQRKPSWKESASGGPRPCSSAPLRA